jgi:hypothetical protein
MRKHCSCVIELLARVGSLKDAIEFVDEISIEPDIFMLKTLLVISKTHNEIHSTRLKRLDLIGYKFVIGFSVYSPNLVSLHCIRLFGYVPMIQNLGHLVIGTIMLDDPCLRNDHRWSQKEDQLKESNDHDAFFVHGGPTFTGLTPLDDNEDD